MGAAFLDYFGLQLVFAVPDFCGPVNKKVQGGKASIGVGVIFKLWEYRVFLWDAADKRLTLFNWLEFQIQKLTETKTNRT